MREAGQATVQTSYGSKIRVQLIISISYQPSVSSTHVANDLLQLETLTQTCAHKHVLRDMQCSRTQSQVTGF
jgi:hypothetical protein